MLDALYSAQSSIKLFEDSCCFHERRKKTEKQVSRTVVSMPTPYKCKCLLGMIFIFICSAMTSLVRAQIRNARLSQANFGSKMDTMQVQAAISALYGSDAAESARANTFLMEFTEQPASTTIKNSDLAIHRFSDPLLDGALCPYSKSMLSIACINCCRQRGCVSLKVTSL